MALERAQAQAELAGNLPHWHVFIQMFDQIASDAIHSIMDLAAASRGSLFISVSGDLITNREQQIHASRRHVKFSGRRTDPLGWMLDMAAGSEHICLRFPEQVVEVGREKCADTVGQILCRGAQTFSPGQWGCDRHLPQRTIASLQHDDFGFPCQDVGQGFGSCLGAVARIYVKEGAVQPETLLPFEEDEGLELGGAGGVACFGQARPVPGFALHLHKVAGVAGNKLDLDGRVHRCLDVSAGIWRAV